MMETLARCHRRKSVTTSYRGEGQIIVYTRSQWWTNMYRGVGGGDVVWFVAHTEPPRSMWCVACRKSVCKRKPRRRGKNETKII